MARTLMKGFETQDANQSDGLTGVNGGVNVASYDTSIFRGGSVSAKIAIATAGANSKRAISFCSGSAYGRVYLRFDAIPSETVTIAWASWFNATLDPKVRVTSAGLFQAWLNNAQVGSSSTFSLKVNTWHRVEMYVKVGAGATDEVAMRVDGEQLYSATGLNLSDSVPGSWHAGCPEDTVSATFNVWLDDAGKNDTTGADQNSWLGEGKIVLLLPISDNARATLWTGGTGGTTNLFDAVNNTPPIGTATETNLTQIEHAGGAAGSTDAYDANMTTYASAGIGPSDTINVIGMLAADGEDSGTGSKLLAYSVVSNPAIASPGNVTAGDDAGALGTYATGWATRYMRGTTYNSTVTVETSPVMRALRPETASRVASVCFMGMCVDYTEHRSPPWGRRHRNYIIR